MHELSLIFDDFKKSHCYVKKLILCMYLARPTYCCYSRVPGRGECGIPEGIAVNTYVPTSTTTSTTN